LWNSDVFSSCFLLLTGSFENFNFVFTAFLTERLQLTELIFFFTNNEHGAWRRARDPLGRAANAEMFPAGVAVGLR
jgi:hypothetical protein